MINQPESYKITICKENHFNETYFVGRVDEFPNISSFEETPEIAREIVLDAIQTLNKIYYG